MGSFAHSQSVPVQSASPLYTPFSVPTVSGMLQYSVSGSLREGIGYNFSNQNDTGGTISANLGFNSPSVLYPFSVSYSGGYTLNSIGQSNQFFQTLNLGQGFNAERWKFHLNDSVYYTPETPSTGYSGIPGVGDIGVSTGTETPQQILTPNSSRISNTVSGSASRNFTGKTSLSANSSYSIQRYLGDINSLQSNTLSLSGDITHHIDARSSVSTGYHRSEFSYLGQQGTFSTQGGTLTYTRMITRRLDLSLGGGPQYIGPSTVTGRPSSLTYSADARISYTGGIAAATSLSAGYVRASNSGSGTNLGAETDTYNLSGTRRITRSLQPGAQVSYSRTTGLSYVGNPGVDTHTLVVSTQANRALSRVVSVYVSYSALHQSYVGSFQGVPPTRGLSQTIAFGVTYSPPAKHIGRQ